MTVRSFVLGVFIATLAGCASSRQPELQTVDPEPVPAAVDVVEIMDADDPGADSSLPMDSAVVAGTLDNGLSYFIRHNEEPVDRVELRLVVNAGSVLEEADQRGLAHFVEHMAFNGTDRFEKQELIDYLELIGTRFGPDLNAYTSFDETVYMLQVRSDSAEILHTGLEILREWASNVSFDPEEIEKERGVVIEEWRLGRGADARMFDKQLPVLLSESHYADRLPIGTPEILQSFEHHRLTDFYERWYRPDLMSVVVVGDVNVNDIRESIETLFADLQSSGDSARPVFDVPDHDETLVASAVDSEAPYSSVSVIYKHPVRPFNTVDDFRQRIVQQLFSNMLNARLDELRQQADPPFLVAGAGAGAFVREKGFYNVNAVVHEGAYLNGLQALFTEVERIRQFGFSESELDRQKSAYLRWYESAFLERDKTESSVYAAEYVRHYLEGEAIPGIAFEYELVQQLLPGIDLAEIDQEADHWLTRKNRVVMMSGPDKESVLPPSKAEVLAVIDAVSTGDLEPYVDATRTDPILPEQPEAGSILEREYDAAVDVTRMTLSNGAKVVLKPTDFKNDEILFAAYSPGGTSLYPDSLDTPGDFASTLIGQSGVGTLDPISLEKMLSDKIVSIGPSIGEMSESLSGSSAPADLEILMQMIHGLMVYPRADSTAYASFNNRLASLVESFSVDPNRVYFDTLSTTLSQNHPRRRPMTPAVVDEMDLVKSFDIYRDRFADADDFTFYFVGAFDMSTMERLIETYVASLPALPDRQETWKDLGVRPPRGVVKKEVRKGLEQQSRVQIILTGPADWNMQNRRVVAALGNVLDIRLREVLREDLGGTYGVSVGGSISRYPQSSYSFSIGFGCDPARVDDLINAIMTEIESLKMSPPDQIYIDKTREIFLNGHEQGLRQNNSWLQWLQFYDRNQLDPQEILTGIPDFAAELTPEMIHDAAVRYLDTENYVQVVLLPELQAGE